MNPFVFKGSDSAHDFIGRVTKALFGLVVAVVVIHAFIPSVYQYLIPITWLERVGEVDRCDPVACLSCLDGLGSGSAGRFVANRYLLRTHNRVSAQGCVQVFS